MAEYMHDWKGKDHGICNPMCLLKLTENYFIRKEGVYTMNYHLEIETYGKRRKKLTGEFGKTYDNLDAAEKAMFDAVAEYSFSDGYEEGCIYVVDEKGKIASGNSWD